MEQKAEKDCGKNSSSLLAREIKKENPKLLIMNFIESFRKSSKDSEFFKVCDGFEEFIEKNKYKGLNGHFTASAVILDDTRSHMVLTLHAKLGRWLQLGGHIEQGEGLWEAAHREGLEESGFSSLSPCGSKPFDLDFHYIPARKSEEEHYHFDVTYIFFAPEGKNLEISDESLDLKWFHLDEVVKVSEEKNLHRIVSLLKQRTNLDNEQFALSLS